MRRFALLVISLVLTFTLLAISAPPSEAVPFPSHQSTATKLEIGGSLDQIDSLLNNLTTDLNSLIPQQTTPPSVNITSVKTVNTGTSSTTPQVIVTVKNGKVALDGVRIDAVSYTHLRAHETKANLVCRLLLEKKK